MLCAVTFVTPLCDHLNSGACIIMRQCAAQWKRFPIIALSISLREKERPDAKHHQRGG
jgi:hypothetical protein